MQAYGLREKMLPFPIKVNSTRAAGTSWAFHYQASETQSCTADSEGTAWSSVYTFSKFYEIDACTSAYASFNQRVANCFFSLVGLLHLWYLGVPFLKLILLFR